MAMSADLNRTAAGLGLAAAASVLLGLADGIPWRMVRIDTAGIVLMLVLAAVAVAAGVTRMRLLVWIAGLGFVAAAALQLVQLYHEGTNTFGGNGSTIALWLAFAVGLSAIGLSGSSPASTPTPTPTPESDNSASGAPATSEPQPAPFWPDQP